MKPPDDRPELVTYTHPAGMRLRVPAGWELSADPRPGIVLVAVEPQAATAFRANLVVTVDRLPAGVDLAGWQAGTEALLPTTLHDYRRLDTEQLALGGVPATRRLARHRSKGGHDVTMEQWATVLPPDGALGWSLTASTATADYPRLAGTIAAVAAGWRPGPHSAVHLAG